MTVNTQEDKYSCCIFKNFNIMKLQDSSYTGRMWENDKRNYIIKNCNMLPLANFVPNTHCNRGATVWWNVVVRSHMTTTYQLFKKN